jgi:cell division protein FtsI (penicillin-binding protein 3)
VIVLAAFAVVLVRVGKLQSSGGDDLRSAGASQWTRDRPIRAARGAIFDRNGEELALSVPASTVSVNPLQVTDPKGTAQVLATILGLESQQRQDLATQIAARDRGFRYVARQVDAAAGEQIESLQLAGVTVVSEDLRRLPGGDTARSVIGRTDIDGVGIAGLEKQYDDVLAGTPGNLRLQVGADGRSIAGSENLSVQPVPGGDIVLTIDRSVQYAVEQALLGRVAELGARGGQVIVMSTKTGEIAAMASVRLNDQGEYEVTSANHSLVEAFEPGSVGKVITIAAALNQGTVTPDTVFVVPWQKVYTKSGERLSDAGIHPDQAMSVADILVQSSNIGTITVSETIGLQTQWEYMRRFGLGEPTGLEFPDENPGILKHWADLYGLEKYTIAYGQGVSSSPLQLVSAVNVIANDGGYVAPKLLMATIDNKGNMRPTESSPTHEVLVPEVAVQMQDMMRDVVCDGTATLAQVPNIEVAGKTGTGYIAQPDGGYDRPDGTKAYYSSFVGFLPVDDPQVTILVSIDQPPADSNDRFGGTAAAPVFRELAPMMVRELDVSIMPGSTSCSG